jgi:hypothetical protein
LLDSSPCGFPTLKLGMNRPFRFEQVKTLNVVDCLIIS